MSNLLQSIFFDAAPRTAIAGLPVPDRPNYFYGTLGDANGESIEFHSALIAPNVGDSVRVLPVNPALPREYRLIFWLRDASDADLPAPIVGTIYQR